MGRPDVPWRSALSTRSSAPAGPVIQPVRVGSVASAAPGILEVVVEGLVGIDPSEPDVFVYLLVRLDGTPFPADYAMADYLDAGAGDPVRGAYYTVRRHDAARARTTFWVVDHGHPGSVAAWLATAEPGTPLLAWGPRPGFEPPAGLTHLVVAVDATGLAAAARLLETVPATVGGTVVVEVADPATAALLPSHPGLAVVTVAADLVAAVGALPPPPPPPATAAAFVAAERAAVRHLRRLIRRRWRLPADRVLATAYWRHPDDGEG